MVKKVRKAIKEFFTTPKIGDITPSYLRNGVDIVGPFSNFPYTTIRSEESIYREKQESIALANMALQKKALVHSLKIQHKELNRFSFLWLEAQLQAT